MNTIIKNGTIVDGTGKPAFVGDVVVENDRKYVLSQGGKVKNFCLDSGRVEIKNPASGPWPRA